MFTKDIMPIFREHCHSCHAEGVTMGTLSLETYEGVMRGGNHGAIVTPGKSGESRLYLMISGKMAPGMPMGAESLRPGDIESIRKWIDAGAKGPDQK